MNSLKLFVFSGKQQGCFKRWTKMCCGCQDYSPTNKPSDKLFFRNQLKLKTSSLFENLQIFPTRYFCTSSEKNDVFSRHSKTVKKGFNTYFVEKKEQLRDTEQRIKEKSSIILKDIKETKDKVKGKVEEIIEVCVVFLCCLRIAQG